MIGAVAPQVPADIDRFIARARALTIGCRMDDLGLRPKTVAAKEMAMVGDAETFDEIALLNGEAPSGDACAKRSPDAATMSRCRSSASPSKREEVPGPVMSVILVDDVEDAVAPSDATAFGFLAHPFPRDHRRLMPAPDSLQSGDRSPDRSNDARMQRFHTGGRLSCRGGKDGVCGSGRSPRRQPPNSNRA